MQFKRVSTNENSIQQLNDLGTQTDVNKVNFNNLISRCKKEQAKEKVETFIFVGLACLLIVVSGIIVSLQ